MRRRGPGFRPKPGGPSHVSFFLTAHNRQGRPTPDGIQCRTLGHVARPNQGATPHPLGPTCRPHCLHLLPSFSVWTRFTWTTERADRSMVQLKLRSKKIPRQPCIFRMSIDYACLPINLHFLQYDTFHNSNTYKHGHVYLSFYILVQQ
jgi:hypothetical protein